MTLNNALRSVPSIELNHADEEIHLCLKHLDGKYYLVSISPNGYNEATEITLALYVHLEQELTSPVED